MRRVARRGCIARASPRPSTPSCRSTRRRRRDRRGPPRPRADRPESIARRAVPAASRGSPCDPGCRPACRLRCRLRACRTIRPFSMAPRYAARSSVECIAARHRGASRADCGRRCATNTPMMSAVELLMPEARGMSLPNARSTPSSEPRSSVRCGGRPCSDRSASASGRADRGQRELPVDPLHDIDDLDARRRRAVAPRRRSRARPRTAGCARRHSRCACRALRSGPAPNTSASVALAAPRSSSACTVRSRSVIFRSASWALSPADTSRSCIVMEPRWPRRARARPPRRRSL